MLASTKCLRLRLGCGSRDCQEVADLKIVELGWFMTKLWGMAPQPRQGSHDKPKLDTTKVQLSEPLSFIGVTYRVRNNLKTAVSSKPTSPWMTTHKAGNLEQPARPAGLPTHWRVSFQVTLVYTLSGSLARVCLFQEAGLISRVLFATWRVCVTLMNKLFIVYSGEGGTYWIWSVSGTS